MLDERKAALAGTARYSYNHSRHDTAERWQRVSSRRRCLICDHSTWCLISNDETVAGCMRIDRGSFKTARTRGGDIYFHRLRDDNVAAQQRTSPTRGQPRTRLAASIDHRHAVYSSFLERLTLSPRHAAFLIDTKRLSHETVSLNLYATNPESETGTAACTELAAEFDLIAVPGFYRAGNGWRFDARREELLIPCRDDRGRIGAVLRRTGGEPKYLWASSARHGGASSGAPPHFARPHLVELNGDIIITEGPLKADAIAEQLGCAVVGLAGVGSFGDTFGSELRLALPGICIAYVAFDADERRKPQVRTQLVRLVRSLRRTECMTKVLQWNEAEGKGLDDVLLRGEG